MKAETHVEVMWESGAGFEDEREGEVVRGKAVLAHGGIDRNGIAEGVVGDHAANEGVVEEDVGVRGLGENDGSVLRGGEVEGRA